MNRLSTINHNGKVIIYIDFSNFKKEDKEELFKLFDYANKCIARNSPKSALLISNFTNVVFDKELSERVNDFASKNTPYVKASALIGITGLQLVLLSMIKTATGRDFYLAKTLEEAKTWLTSN